MQGRGRGQLSFGKAQPVTAPATIASVTYDDPNGSWESWEPGASWNGTGGGGGHNETPAPSAQHGQGQHAQPPKNEAGLRWDEDSDTNLRQPNKQLPGTLITMSELDWEDTEELATELWRHPMRPRISRDAHAAPRQPTRSSPVRPDPRHLPMPLPGPGGARPHARSEEPTARLRMSGPNVLTRTGAQPRVSRNAPPQHLPAAPPPRPELAQPEPRSRTITQPGAAATESAAGQGASGTSSTSMPEDWLTGPDLESLPSSFSGDGYSERMPEAFMSAPPSGADRFAPRAPLQPSATNPSQPAAASRFAPQPAALPPAAAGGFSTPQPPGPGRHGQPGPLQPSAAGGFSPQPPGAGRYAPQPVAAAFSTQPPADRYASLPSAAAPSLPAATLTPPPAAGYAPHTTGLQRPGSLIQTQAAGFSAGPPAQLPPAPPPRPSLPAEPLTQTQSFDAQLPPAPPPRPSLPSEPLTRTQAFEAHAPAAPHIESLRERTLTPPRLLPPPPRFPSSAHIPTIIGTPAASSAPTPTRGRPEPQPSLAQSGARLQPRAAGRDAGRDAMMAPPPPSPAQSQLIEQLQEQLLEAMARARVQEARAAEAEKSVEQAEEQLAAVARGHSEETEQLEQQLLQLSEQLEAAEQRAAQAERRPRQPDNMLHLAEADLVPRPNKQGRANLILSGLLASSLSFGGAAYFMFYAPLQKQLAAVEQLRTQDSQAHATAVSNLQARSTAERQGLEAQNAELRKQLEAARAEASSASAQPEDARHGRGRRSSDADAQDGTPAGTRSARAIERRMRRSARGAAQAEGDEAEAPRRKAAPARDDSNDPLGGI